MLRLLILLIASATATAATSPAPKSSDLALKLLEAARPSFPPQTRFVVENIHLKGAAPASAKLEVLTPHPPIGLVTFTLDFGDGPHRVRTFGTATIRAFGKIAVAKSLIRIGDPLTRENVVFEEHELTPLVRTGFFADWDGTTKLLAAGYLQPGTILTEINCRAPYAVVQGETIDLLSHQRGITITAKVKALENGNIEHWIRVQNPASGKVLQARVTSAGQVELR